MSRRAARITQADVARALRAAEQVAPGRLVVEVTPDGVIRIAPLGAQEGPRRPVEPPLAQEEEIIL